MKRMFLMLFTFLFAMNVQAAELKEGKQYFQLNTAPSATPEVIEFFSFYCPLCYAFEYTYKIPSTIKNNLPANVEFKQYHFILRGRQDEENLTRAWALAMALGVEEKVKKPLFDAAQKKNNQPLNSMADIRAIFIEQGISAEQFDGGINSFMVNALFNKQVNLAKQLKVPGVPDFYVNGRFRINISGLNQRNLSQDYLDTINGLLQK